MLNKITVLLFAVVTLTSHAESPALYTEAEPRAWNSQSLEAGIGFYDFDYKEEIPPPGKSTEKGIMKTVNLGYSMPLGEAFVLRGILELGGTNTVYDGSLQDGTPKVSETKNLIIAPEIDLMVPLITHDSGHLLGYTGLAFRYWRRDLGADPAGYLEDYSMFTLPVGLQYRLFLGENFSIGPDLSLRLMAGGNVVAHMEKFGMKDLSLPLGPRFGGRLSLPVSFWSLFGQGTSLVVTPFYEYLGIGDGKVEYAMTTDGEKYLVDERGNMMGFKEPASKTHMVGITTAVRIAF